MSERFPTGEEILARRTEQSLSRSVLAAKFGIDEHTLLNYETGITKRMNNDQAKHYIKSWYYGHYKTYPTEEADDIESELALTAAQKDAVQAAREARQKDRAEKQAKAIRDHVWIESEKAGRNMYPAAALEWIDKYSALWDEDYRRTHPTESDAIDALLVMAKNLVNPQYSHADRANILSANMIQIRIAIQPMMESVPADPPVASGC